MKRILKVLLTIVIGAVAGGGVFFALEFIEGGGGVEELKVYLKETVIPSAVSIITTLFMLYFGCTPTLNKAKVASDGFLATNAIIGSVSQTSAETSASVGALVSDLRVQMDQVSALKAQLEVQAREQIAVTNELRLLNETTQQMIATGFGNMPELVKSGMARKIYKIMEGMTDEAED